MKLSDAIDTDEATALLSPNLLTSRDNLTAVLQMYRLALLFPIWYTILLFVQKLCESFYRREMTNMYE